MNVKLGHIPIGAEIFVLAALPAWMQSPTGSTFLHAHMSIADLVAAAYVGFRAVKLAADMNKDQPTPAEPGKEPNA